MHTTQRRIRMGTVPVVGERLRWALARRGLSHGEAARRIAPRLYGNTYEGPKEDKSLAVRIDRLCGGKRERCETALRTGLAKLVRIPDKWLGGELEGLPGGGQPAKGRTIPTREQLAHYDLWLAVKTGCDRELAAAETTPGPKKPRRTANFIDFSEMEGFAWSLPTYLRSLVEPAWWRGQLMNLQLPSSKSDLLKRLNEWPKFKDWPRAPWPTREEEEAREHLVKAFSYILQPWNAGEAELNEALFEALWPNRGKGGRAKGRPERLKK